MSSANIFGYRSERRVEKSRRETSWWFLSTIWTEKSNSFWWRQGQARWSSSSSDVRPPPTRPRATLAKLPLVEADLLTFDYFP